MGYVEDLVAALSELSRVLLADVDLRTALQAIADRATHTVPGCDWASVSMRIEGKPETTAASDRVALELDLLQYHSGEGPCLAAITGRQRIRLTLIGPDERFQHFVAGAREVGVTAVLSLPV